MFFAWTDALSLGVRSIDEQHRKLIWMINDIHGYIAEKNGLTAQSRIIHEVLDYPGTHFRHEEGLIERYEFKGREGHMKTHADFTTKALDLKRRSGEERFILTQKS